MNDVNYFHNFVSSGIVTFFYNIIKIPPGFLFNIEFNVYSDN